MDKKARIFLFLVLGAAAPLWCSMDTELVVLGFSAGGSYVACQVSGQDPCTLVFSMVQIVNVAANDFATGDIVVRGMEELPELKVSALGGRAATSTS